MNTIQIFQMIRSTFQRKVTNIQLTHTLKSITYQYQEMLVNKDLEARMVTKVTRDLREIKVRLAQLVLTDTEDQGVKMEKLAKQEPREKMVQTAKSANKALREIRE